MTNLTEIKPQQESRDPMNPLRVAYLRIMNDLIIIVLYLFLIIPVINTTTAWIVIISSVGILFTSLIGLVLINRGRSIHGLGLLIYGLNIGFFVNSLFIEGWGVFSFFIIILFTLLSISTSIPQKRIIEAIITSTVIGIASVIIDINLKGADFRIGIPTILLPILWVIAAIILIIFGITFYRQFPYFTLRTKIITSFVIITLVISGIVSLLNNRRINSILIEEANEALFAAASQTVTALDNFITTNLNSIRTEGQIPLFIKYSQAPPEEQKLGNLRYEVAGILVALRGKNPRHIASYAILDTEGNILIDSEPMDIGKYEGDYPYFLQVIQTNSAQMSSVEFPPGEEKAYIYFGTPIRSPLQEPQGVLRVKYDANILQAMLAPSKDLVGKDSFGVLFDEYLIHLAHGNAPETLFTTVTPLETEILQRLKDERRLPDLPSEEIFHNFPDLGANLTTAIKSEEGVSYFDAEDIATADRINQVVVIDMENPSWMLAFFQPKDIFLKPVANLVNSTILFGLASTIGSVVIAIGFTQILTKPINRLTESANQLSQGNLSARSEVTSEDEIGELSNTFNNMASQLQNLIINLEDQVAARTLDLEARAVKLQATAEIARDVTSESEIPDLLDRAATLISDRFDLYHVGIYLVDGREEYAILVAGNDITGEQLIDSEHRFHISTESNVGYTCTVGEPRLAPSEDNTVITSYHPLLQKTAAQMVLPLKVGNKIMGAVDFHSTNPSAFTQNDVPIFHTMVDQLAIAIQKTEFREEIQKNLQELEVTSSFYTRESWRRFIQGKEENIKGYVYSQNKVEPATRMPPEVIEAWTTREAVSQENLQMDNDIEGTSNLAIPLKIRGEVIGVLNLQLASNQIPMEINNFIQELANRFSLVLENARLVEVAQRRVERERITGEITNKIRQTLDIDSVLRAAVQELGETFDLAEVEVQMGDIQKTTFSDSYGNQDNITPETDVGEV
jgi:GAF domain-containing protein/HAMP domain-containing protein